VLGVPKGLLQLDILPEIYTDVVKLAKRSVFSVSIEGFSGNMGWKSPRIVTIVIILLFVIAGQKSLIFIFEFGRFYDANNFYFVIVFFASNSSSKG
jgi:hypothetical protein